MLSLDRGEWAYSTVVKSHNRGHTQFLLDSCDIFSIRTLLPISLCLMCQELHTKTKKIFCVHVWNSPNRLGWVARIVVLGLVMAKGGGHIGGWGEVWPPRMPGVIQSLPMCHWPPGPLKKHPPEVRPWTKAHMATENVTPWSCDWNTSLRFTAFQQSAQ